MKDETSPKFRVGDTFYGRAGNVNFFATIRRISNGAVTFDYNDDTKSGSPLKYYVCSINGIQFYVNEYKIANSPLGKALS